MAAFDAAHPADVRIGQTVYTPVPTPGNEGTATALAATNTPAYGNGSTATAVAQQTGTPEPPCTSCTITFSDVHPADYFYGPVQYLACLGVVSGYADGTFRPYANTTRGQFSKMLVLGRGWPIATPSTPTFADVPTTHPFFGVVETAHAQGVISGYDCGAPGEPCPGGYFRPGVYITRGQMSKLIALGMNWPLLNPSAPTFEDVLAGSPFYQAVETVYAHGVISGYSCGPGCLQFRPGNNATRGQLSKVLSFALMHP
jgi:S-layer homology domain